MPRLDKFYTKRTIAQRCLDSLDLSRYDVLLEPSAGSGAFFDLLPTAQREGYDLEPAFPGGEIATLDFFEYEADPAKTYLVVGNPPFGKNSSLAKRFFTHAAKFAQTIAFVLPRTFRKTTTINQLPAEFHQAEEIVLPMESFELPDGSPYEVPCVFQVWERKGVERERIVEPKAHPDFSFLSESKDCEISEALVSIEFPIHYGQEEVVSTPISIKDYESLLKLRKRHPLLFRHHKVKRVKRDINWKTRPDFIIRRAGAQAGKITLDYKSAALEGNLFIKAHDNKVVDIFRRMWDTWWNPSVDTKRANSKWDTAGTPSLSKGEIITHYEKMKEKFND